MLFCPRFPPFFGGVFCVIANETEMQQRSPAGFKPGLLWFITSKPCIYMYYLCIHYHCLFTAVSRTSWCVSCADGGPLTETLTFLPHYFIFCKLIGTQVWHYPLKILASSKMSHCFPPIKTLWSKPVFVLTNTCTKFHGLTACETE